MGVNDQQITFNVLDAMKSFDDVENYNFISIMDFIVTKRLTSFYSNEEIKATVFEVLENEELETVDQAWLGEKQLYKINK